MTGVEFLETDTVVYLHDAAIAAYGGAAGLNDANMLESALAHPATGWPTLMPEVWTCSTSRQAMHLG